MDERVGRIASMANKEIYTGEATRRYVDGAPHIKHSSLRHLYGELCVRVIDLAMQDGRRPRVLDLGAGEGSATLPFLELGGEVTAVDISKSQLANLQKKCARFCERLDVHCGCADAVMNELNGKYDIVVINSFLHHIPDYLGFIEQTFDCLAPGGIIFTFQDPMRYDGLTKTTRIYGEMAYLSWRIPRLSPIGVLGGIGRRIRHKFGVYYEDSAKDNAEYHIVRNGVDQDAIQELLERNDFETEIIRYCSVQNGVFQKYSKRFNVENTFATIARKKAGEA